MHHASIIFHSASEKICGNPLSQSPAFRPPSCPSSSSSPEHLRVIDVFNCLAETIGHQIKTDLQGLKDVLLPTFLPTFLPAKSC